MDKALEIALSTIAEQCCLTVPQTMELAETNDISDRYETCKGCRMDCKRCQIAFKKTKRSIN